MKVIFKTNLDRYPNDVFPNNLDDVPRIGDCVQVTSAYIANYSASKRPTKLEVVSVTWTEKNAICELWYSELDVKIAKNANIDLF